MYHSRGMQRSCVILQDAITTIQFMRLSRKSGIFEYERYIDASEHKSGCTKRGTGSCTPAPPPR
jgi:hypothetical protein